VTAIDSLGVGAVGTMNKPAPLRIQISGKPAIECKSDSQQAPGAEPE
jgi:hypothetical protein